MSSLAEMSPTFTSLHVSGWRQFDNVDIAFHPRLTVITGANAAGKTTLLSLLATHFGWNPAFVATPAMRRSGLSFLTGWWRRRSVVEPSAVVTVGAITYTNGGVCQLQVPQELGGAAFNVAYSAQQPVTGLFISSHRPTGVYQQLSSIPTSFVGRQHLLEMYLNEVRTRHQGGHTGFTPAYRLKEALVSLAMFGYGNEIIEGNPEAVSLFEGFVGVLRQVLPPSMGFQRLSVRPPEVVVESSSGDFSLDAVSGGVAAIIDLAFQVYLRTDTAGHVVIIDEPENHLHPELQRSLLPGMLQAFPTTQFIVATHSSLVVGAVPDSNVYALRYNYVSDNPSFATDEAQRKVSSLELDAVNKAGSSNEVLREVLGLDATVPIWVEAELARIVEEHLTAPVTTVSLATLRTQLGAVGMADAFPDALERLVARDDPAD